MTTLIKTTMEVSINNIPNFVKQAELYKNIIEIDNEIDIINSNSIFTIPCLYCKPNLIIKDINDFIHILYICNYWGIIDLPFEIYDYIQKNKFILKNNLTFIKTKLNGFGLFKECEIFIMNELVLNSISDNYISMCGDICYLKIIKYFHIYKGYNFKYFLKVTDIIKNNYIKCLEYIDKNEEYIIDDHSLLFSAIDYDNLECLEYLITRFLFVNDVLFNYSIKTGSIRCFKYLYEKYFKISCINCYDVKECSHNDDLLYLAIDYDNVEFIKYLNTTGILIDYKFFNYSIKKCSIECLKYLYENKLFNQKSLCYILDFSITSYNLECVIYLREKGIPWSENTFYMTIIGGDIECIKYLHKKNCPYDNYICLYLACIRKKNIECFKYLYENSFLFDNSRLFYNVIKHAEIEFFKYLDNSGFKFNYSMYRNIIRYNREDIIIYLQENKPFLNKIIFNAYKKISNRTIIDTDIDTDIYTDIDTDIENYTKNTKITIITKSISYDSQSYNDKYITNKFFDKSNRFSYISSDEE